MPLYANDLCISFRNANQFFIFVDLLLQDVHKRVLYYKREGSFPRNDMK